MMLYFLLLVLGPGPAYLSVLSPTRARGRLNQIYIWNTDLEVFPLVEKRGQHASGTPKVLAVSAVCCLC